MTKTYGVILLIVLALALAPVFFLARRHTQDFTGRTVLHNIYSAKIKSVDPATCGDTTSASMQGQVYEGLYAYHYLKRPVELVPLLAVEMPEVTADGLVYTFRLKPDIRFTPNPCFGIENTPDGPKPKTRPMKADDFVLEFKRIADFHLQTQLAWSFLSGRIVGLDEFREQCKSYKEGDFSRYDLPVEGLEVVDDLTLRIHLTAIWPQLPYILAIHNYCPMPREVIDYHLATRPGPDGQRVPIPIEERIPQITTAEAVVGTGAYQLTLWERASLMVFERNPVYRHGVYPGEGSPGDAEAGLLADAGQPLPLIDVLRYVHVEEDLPSWLKFLSMQTDVSGIPRDVFQMVISPDRDLLDQWKQKGIELVKFDDPSVFWLAYNMEDPVVGGCKPLRQGMCLAFNVEDYIDVLFNGRGLRPINVLPSSFPGRNEAGRGPYYVYDPQRARQRLDQAREELRAAGRLDSSGRIPEITLDMPGRDESYRRMGEFVQQQFEPFGVRVRIELNDWPTLQQKVHNKQVQMYAMGWSADYPDAENFLQLYYSPNIDKGTNNTNYRNPDFDALYERAIVTVEEQDRLPLYVEMVHMLNEDVPVLLLSEPLYYVLKYNWVKNYKRSPFGYGNTKFLRLDTQMREQYKGSMN